MTDLELEGRKNLSKIIHSKFATFMEYKAQKHSELIYWAQNISGLVNNTFFSLFKPLEIFVTISFLTVQMWKRGMFCRC
jgi:hypothetical protein